MFHSDVFLLENQHQDIDKTEQGIRVPIQGRQIDAGTYSKLYKMYMF